MSDYALQAALVRQALELEGLSRGETQRALAIARSMEADLRVLLAQGTMSDARRTEIDNLVRKAEDIIRQRFSEIDQEVDLREVMIHVGDETARGLGGILQNVSRVTPERLASLTRDVLLFGGPASEYWQRQAASFAWKFEQQVRGGVLEGATNEQIVARIYGIGDEPGIVDKNRRDIRALVHSSIQTSANHARRAVYEKNSVSISGVRWLATLDHRTCVTCMALDGKAWEIDGDPIDHDLDFKMPPAHFNCRCILSPIAGSLDDVFGIAGIDDIFRRGRVRASKDGPTEALTFGEFLRTQSPEFVETTLGPGRAQLWRDGKITLRDLVSASGQTLTLEQIRAR